MTTESPLDLRSTNALWASVLVETLSRAGVRRAVVSPGSRSTPLTLAFARHSGFEAIPVLDERSAGFFALGIAKAAMEPVVLLCTSGTAAANYYPAVIEAHESGVPLIVITADRPPELRACASGQTIDQQKIFGGYVSFYHELAVPEPTLSRLCYLRQTVLHACERAMAPAFGPVHLNAPFRDPLVPHPDGRDAVPLEIDASRFFAHVTPVRRTRSTAPSIASIDTPARGIIVVGNERSGNPAEQSGLVADIARKLGWPVLTDGLSNLRNCGESVPHLVTTADLILRNASAAERLKPEMAVCVGGWPTSKVLRGWLEAAEPQVILFSERLDNRDALHGKTRQYSDLGALLHAMHAGAVAGAETSDYLRLWLSCEAKARSALDARLSSTSDLFEGKAAWLLAQKLPERTPIAVANSMPVRDVEFFWPPNDRRAEPFCNRGANGIDGTLSTALGIAHASGRPAVLLTGDLALLHDTNGFLIAEKARASLTIVLINNRGGGIFEHLPVAKVGDAFEDFFATPQDVDIARLVAGYRVEYVSVRDWDHFQALIGELPSTGVRIVEIVTDRKRDAAFRRELFSGLSRDVG